MRCVWCGKLLEGRQRRFCSLRCKNIHGVTKWRREAKRWAIEYKGGACERCGYDKCQAAMIFHHPGKKSYGVGSGHARSKAKMRKELDKCELLCLNCHAEEHYDEVHRTGIV